MASSLQRQLYNARRHLKVLSESPALQSPEGYIQQREKMLELLHNRLISAQIQQTNRKKQRFIGLTAKLDAMSPLKVLTRGYAMAQTEDGCLIRSISDVRPQEQITVSLTDGNFTATVNEVKERAQ